MLVLRFANGIFEPIWNRQFIDHVQITVAESLGVEGRGELLREGRGDPGRRPEPHAPARRADRDGAADRLRRRVRAEREGQGAPGAAHARAEARRARAVRHRLHRGRGGSRLPRGGGCRARTPRRRPTSPPSSTWTTGAGPTRPSTSAPASASRAGRRRSRSSSSALRTRPSRSTTRRAAAPERAPHPHPARRGRLARHRREGARAGRLHPHRAHGLPLRRRVPHRAARGLRAPHPRLSARRRDALHARRRGGGAVGDRGRDGRALAAATGRTSPTTRPGPGARLAADELLHRDGRSWRRH